MAERLGNMYINVPITYKELNEAERVQDMFDFMWLYDIKQPKTESYKGVCKYLNNMCPLGTYFGCDEFEVIGFWELNSSQEYLETLEEYYEGF
jgi:hypothetical protein